MLESNLLDNSEVRTPKYSFLQILMMSGAVMAAQFMYSYTFALTAPLSRQLEFSKTWTQVFSAFGPIAGGIIQPLIGMLSDKVHTRLGKRKPFIIVGQIGTAIALIIQMIIFLGISEDHKSLRKGLFVFSMIICNIFVQAIQGPARTLIADILPASQQVIGNAVATGLIAFAAITCNFAGFILTEKPHSGFLQLEVFVPFISLTLAVLGTVATCVTAHEEDSHEETEFISITPESRVKKSGNSFKDMFETIRNLDRHVILVAVVLMISWAAYYPFQYNATNYYAVDIFNNDPDQPDTPGYKKGIGHGMLMLALNNVVTLLSGFVNQKLIDAVGPKVPYAFSQIVECAILIAAIYINKEWPATLLFSIIGISQNIFNIVPYTIVGICVPKQQMGLVIGSLNIFVVVGQLISGTLICPFIAGDEKLVKGKIGPVIAVGAPFALIATILSFFIKIPKQGNFSEVM